MIIKLIPKAKIGSTTFWQIAGRLIVMLQLSLLLQPFLHQVSFLNSIWALALAAIVLTVLDYIIAKFTGIQASPFGKGFVGFILAAIILYLTQFFVAGYSISWIAAIIGALVYGIVDYIIPGEQQM